MEAAARVDTSSERAELIQLVTFSLGDEEYGVNVLKVREIIRMTTITRVPNAPSYVEGVINLRGKVIPIASIRRKLHLEDVERDSRTRIMVMEVGSELMGFIVDAVSEVIRITSNEIQPPPAVVNGGMEQDCLFGVINRNEHLLVLLDLEKLFSVEERRTMGAANA
ncbi:MAG TPA: chemotaxis protein CheW [Geobacterales bacterium]|nr:chemotaxis protein CheW [Geobacterales bacterium]